MKRKPIQEYNFRKLEQLGQGSFGVAYAADQKTAIKITSSYSEYQNALKLKGRRLKYVWKVYDCGELSEKQARQVQEHHWKFDDYESDQLYWIMGERLQQMGDSTRNRLFDSEDTWGDPTGPMWSKLQNYARRSWRWGIDHSDTHDGNVMKDRRGNFKFVDVM